LTDEQLLHDIVTLQEGQLLAILTLHHCLILVERVWWELVQVAEGEVDELCFPLNSEVVLVGDVELFSIEHMRLEFSIWSTCHPSETLIATAFVDGENEEDWVILRSTTLTSLNPCIIEALGWSKRRRPHARIMRLLHRLYILALHYEKASIFVMDRGLFKLSFPLFYLFLVPEAVMAMHVLLKHSRVLLKVMIKILITITTATTTTSRVVVIAAATLVITSPMIVIARPDALLSPC